MKKADEFYKAIESMDLVGTCASRGNNIQSIIANSVRANYTLVKRLIKRFCPDTYHDLALEYYNPWENQTYRSRDGKYIIITHSAIEYLFEVNLV